MPESFEVTDSMDDLRVTASSEPPELSDRTSSSWSLELLNLRASRAVLSGGLASRKSKERLAGDESPLQRKDKGFTIFVESKRRMIMVMLFSGKKVFFFYRKSRTRKLCTLMAWLNLEERASKLLWGCLDVDVHIDLPISAPLRDALSMLQKMDKLNTL